MAPKLESLEEISKTGWVNLGSRDDQLYLYHRKNNEAMIYNYKTGQATFEAKGISSTDFKKYFIEFVPEDLVLEKLDDSVTLE